MPYLPVISPDEPRPLSKGVGPLQQWFFEALTEAQVLGPCRDRVMARLDQLAARYAVTRLEKLTPEQLSTWLLTKLFEEKQALGLGSGQGWGPPGPIVTVRRVLRERLEEYEET